MQKWHFVEITTRRELWVSLSGIPGRLTDVPMRVFGEPLGRFCLTKVTTDDDKEKNRHANYQCNVCNPID